MRFCLPSFWSESYSISPPLLASHAVHARPPSLLCLQRESEGEKAETREKVEEDRKPQIEAAIVRIMKVRGCLFWAAGVGAADWVGRGTSRPAGLVFGAPHQSVTVPTVLLALPANLLPQ